MQTDPVALKSEIHLFLDTNVLIHYPAFDGLNWRAQFGSGSIFLHITQPVLEEIAKKKDMGETKRLRKRCARIVKHIGQMIDYENPCVLPNGERVVIEPAFPIMLKFPTLNPSSVDDQFLACALTFERTSGRKPVVVTADVSLALRARLRGHQLKNVTLPESERLPAEPDADDLEKRELQRRLVALSDAEPSLQVQFQNSLQLLRLERIRIREDLIAQEVQEKKSELQYAQLRQPDPWAVTLGGFGTQQAVDNYNAALDDYFSRYACWWRKCADIVERSYELTISVGNNGKSPAFGVYVHFHFPDGFKLVEQEEFEELLPNEPQPPEEPTDWASRLANMRVPIVTPMFPKIQPIAASENMSIRKTNSFEVEWDAKKIRQGEKKALPSMTLVYDTDPFSFEIPFKAVADNARNAVIGSLHINVVSP